MAHSLRAGTSVAGQEARADPIETPGIGADPLDPPSRRRQTSVHTS